MSLAERNYILYTFKDSSITLDGTASNMTASTSLTSSGVVVAAKEYVSLFLESGTAAAGGSVTARYDISPDGSNWFTGAVSISNLNNNKQVINLTEKSFSDVRLYVNNTNSKPITLTAKLATK